MPRNYSKLGVPETGNFGMWDDVNLDADIPRLDPEGFFINIEGNEGYLVVVPLKAPENHPGRKTFFQFGDNPKCVREIKKSAENTATGVVWCK